VQEVIELAKGGASLDVHVLNVQPRVFVVMGSHGHGPAAGMLLGSVSMKVLHLTDIPVTMVPTQPAIDFSGRLQAT
jgi:hypothetical protein